MMIRRGTCVRAIVGLCLMAALLLGCTSTVFASATPSTAPGEVSITEAVPYGAVSGMAAVNLVGNPLSPYTPFLLAAVVATLLTLPRYLLLAKRAAVTSVGALPN